MIDITGQKFGRLLVICRVENSPSGKTQWKCQCECKDENIIIVSGDCLRRGITKSCGCLQKEITSKRSKTHGHSKAPVYNIWLKMKKRCYDENDPQYKDYGGRGIKICDRWLKSFSNFLEDMGEKPGGLTIERIDNNTGYSPDNCRWASRREQNQNKRNNKYYEYKGMRLTMTEWSRRLGINPSSMFERFEKWTIEEALTTPVRGRS